MLDVLDRFYKPILSVFPAVAATSGNDSAEYKFAFTNDSNEYHCTTVCAIWPTLLKLYSYVNMFL